MPPSSTPSGRRAFARSPAASSGADGVLRIEARRFRTQEKNRRDARERLATLLERAATPPRPRRPTRVSKQAKLRRREAKRRQGRTKALRRGVSRSDDE